MSCDSHESTLVGSPKVEPPSPSLQKSPSLYNVVHQTALINADDYENKYPEDKSGHEADESARVWRVYLDEADKSDAERITRWREGIDILLVFTGLCSAIIAAFVIESSEKLDVSYDAINTSFLRESTALQRAWMKGADPDTVPTSPFHTVSSPTFTQIDVWVNGIWIASLVCSISTALVATVVRQWMQHYLLPVYGTPLERVRVRQSRRNSFKQWSVSAVVRFIPILLHIAVLLFFLGLFLFTLPLNFGIAIFIAIAGVMLTTLYFGSALLPLFYSSCPYRTPLSGWMNRIRLYVFRAWQGGREMLPSSYRDSIISNPEVWCNASVYIPIQTAHRQKYHHLDVDVSALVWMAGSPNESVQLIAAEALGGMVDKTIKMGPVCTALEDVVKRIMASRLYDVAGEGRRDRVFRACLRLAEWRIQSLSPNVGLSDKEQQSCVSLIYDLVNYTMVILWEESTVVRQEWNCRRNFFDQHLLQVGLSQLWHDAYRYVDGSPARNFAFLRLLFNRIELGSQLYEEFIDNVRLTPVGSECRRQLSAFADELKTEGKSNLADALNSALSSSFSKSERPTIRVDTSPSICRLRVTPFMEGSTGKRSTSSTPIPTPIGSRSIRIITPV